MQSIMHNGDAGFLILPLKSKELKKLREDEKEIFCHNIREYENAMYFLAFSLLNNSEDANDAVSESILKAYENFHTLRQKNKFKPWILKIVHNTSVEIIRKNSHFTSFYDECQCKNTDNTDTEITLKIAVMSLKQPYRTVIELYYYEDMKLNEIAQITDTNPVTVRKQLSRGREILREILKEDFR